MEYAWDHEVNITWLVDENPKRLKSKLKFEKYWNQGKNSLADAKKCGMSCDDFLNDFQRGFFTIDPATKDEVTQLGAYLDSIFTESSEDVSEIENSKPVGLVGSILDAPTHFSKDDIVHLENMHDSRYRSRNMNGLKGTVTGWNKQIRRYGVKLALPCDGYHYVYLRSNHLRKEVAPKPRTQVFGPQTLKDFNIEQKEVLSFLEDRIRMLNMDLDEPEGLTTLKLYELMSIGYQAAVAKAFDVYTPKHLRDAVSCNNNHGWIKSILNEVVSQEAGTWDGVHRDQAKTESKTIMKSGFVFRAKSDEHGYLTKLKSRFVCKGYSEKEGVDYFQIRSGVVDYVSARFLIAIAAAERSNLFTYDVKNAFVSTDVPPGEEFYCEPPEDTPDDKLFGRRFYMPDGSRGVLRCLSLIHI